MQKFTTKTIVSLSVLVALQIVLTRFCSFSAWNVRIGFGFVALVIAAVVHGPVAAALVGGLGDMIGAIAFPTGSYFPGFTLTQVLMGLSFGLALYRKPLHVSEANAVDPHADGSAASALDAAASSVLNAALPLPVRTTFAVLFNQLVLSLLMNTLWISIRSKIRELKVSSFSPSSRAVITRHGIFSALHRVPTTRFKLDLRLP